MSKLPLLPQPCLNVKCFQADEKIAGKCKVVIGITLATLTVRGKGPVASPSISQTPGRFKGLSRIPLVVVRLFATKGYS
jgi:hypothetical protein